MQKIIVYLALLLPLAMLSQEYVTGKVVEGEEGNLIPVFGANVYWQGTSVGTVTDIDGKFKIALNSESGILVVSYVGYKTRRIKIDKSQNIEINFEPSDELEEVIVTAEKKATEVSFLNPKNVVKINEKELLKAACCNLSESFETNPSVDVNFSDAVTGTKQIKMLGLTNPYILITQENIPSVRGASQAYGLTFTPGTWLESIQITKGAGSVVNGFESIAGQINTELKKPLTDDQFFLNTYASIDGRLELNTHFNQKLNDKWSTGLYAHINNRSWRKDQNDDGFMDAPLMNQVNLMNRWQYANEETGWVSFFDLRYMNDSKVAGQINFDPETDKKSTTIWGSEIKTKRLDVSNKTGYVFKDQPYKSFGFQNSFSLHDQDSYFGLRDYYITHKSWYSNFVYNSILYNTKHKFKTGLSFTYDNYDELVSTNSFGRYERSLGSFFEYTFDNGDNFSLVAGVRADTHNLLGEFITPRLHMRYNPWEKAVIRASAGRGKRSANIFAENQQYFASSRNFSIIDTDGEIYGLNPEIAWNFGGSFLQGFRLFDRAGRISLDYYITDFKNQAVVDVDHSPQEVRFYNLDGKSIAKSFQADLDYRLLGTVDFRLSYKYYDVNVDYENGSLSKPLLAKHRVFSNLSYESCPIKGKGKQWKFDVTWNWIGKQRLPQTQVNPVEYQLPTESNPFSQVNAQVTKVFSKHFEVYLGAENLLGYKQDNPINAAIDPFGAYFDSTMIYAPIQGARVYTGIRLKVN
ncbi:TonB-dependent receptor [Pseudofulvibacter geojedonensis]|uniref:TonB-dependent receptor domain-containing protein n=1 Tax=Pseudofulvibacter geojedonensis TaxID=1123758 RepID=A0ABW3I357_9FLAO